MLKKKKKNLTGYLANWVTDIKISNEFNQSEKKQPGIHYAMNFSYDSHTLTLISVYIPFFNQKNKF